MTSGRVAILTTNHFHPAGDRIIYGGAEKYGLELSRLLLSLGFEVSWWQIGDGWQKEILPGVLVRTLPATEAPFHTIPQLNQAFHERAVDHDYFIYFVTFLAYPQAMEPSISISHGVYWDYPGFDATLNTEADRAEWRRRLWIALSGPRRVVSVDTATINWVAATFPGLVSRFEYIPNFVDVAAVDATEPAGKAPGRIRVVYPRRLTTVRGINEMVRVAEVLSGRYPEVEFHFIGRGHQDEVEKDMMAWVSRHPGTYYYWLPPEDVLRVLKSTDIAVIPSKAAEGTSLACLEAMAAGCAVIASWVGGLGNLIIDGYNGLVIKPTVQDLLTSLERLIRDEDLRVFLGRNARETARAFDLPVWQQRWRKVIQSIFV